MNLTSTAYLDWPIPDALDISSPRQALIEWQSGRCAACGRVPRLPLVEDHDHETWLVRGFLCRSCNAMEAKRPAQFVKYRGKPPTLILGMVYVYRYSRSSYSLRGAPLLTPEQRSERNRAGGLATAAARTPEQRSAAASRAWLGAAINGIVRRATELDPAQLDLLTDTVHAQRETRLRTLAAELADPTEADHGP